MNKKLRILHLEDLHSDAELIGRELKKGKIDFERLVVDTKDKFIKALQEFSPDIILSDHSLPSFNSSEALVIFHEAGLKIPFILITGAMSDEFAVDIIKRGADDYILKDRLMRLPIAILNSLEKFRLEKERQIFLDELISNEKKFRALIENSADGIVILSKEGKPIFVSPSVEKVLGYTQEEIMQMDLFTITHSDDILPLANIMKQVLANPGVSMQGHTGRMRHKDGSWRWLEATVTNMLHDPSIAGIVDNFRDITERKIAEEKIINANRLYSFMSQINETLVYSGDEQTVFKEACRSAIEYGKFISAWIGMIDIDKQKIHLVEIFGLPTEDISSFTDDYYNTKSPQYNVLRTGDYFVSNNIKKDLEFINGKALASLREYNSCLVLPIRKSGSIIGTFNLYSSELNFFNSEEIALLEEATANISFALDVFEKDAEKKMLQQQLLQEQITNQKEITKAIVNTQEKERADIGGELHDNVTQLLAASRLYLDRSLSNPGDNREYIKKCREYITTAMEDIRKLSHALAGPTLDKSIGLIDSLKKLIKNVSIGKDIKISFDYYVYHEEESEVELTLVIYRIIQEYLNNILKNQEASEVEIELKKEAGDLILIMNDNGKGRNTSAQCKDAGLNNNIINRAEVYNGVVGVLSSPGKGCKMKIIFPVLSGVLHASKLKIA